MGTVNCASSQQYLLHPNMGSAHPTYGSVNSNFEANETELMIKEGAVIEGKMSVNRRFFILLTVFDVLFTLLLWLICTMISDGYDITTSFRKEVVCYSIKSSIFDVVMLAAARFMMIILFYAIIRISHWWVIALTTAGSGAFIIVKVFLYSWANANKTTSSLLLLCSFILSWAEAWFLDIKVLPSEMRASAYLANQESDRAPILPSSTLSRSQSDDGSAFYSPPGSDDEEGDEKEHDGSTVSEVEWLSPKDSGAGLCKPSDQDYKKLAEEALDVALRIISSENWRTEKVEGDDIIYSQYLPKYGKIFKFVGVLNLSPEKVIDELYFKGEEMHKWNPTVKKVRIIQRIDKHIDVTHVIATEGAAGLVASRDFVNVRIWQKREDTYVHASAGTTHPDCPVVTKYVRGEQGPCAYILTPLDGKPNKCMMQWLLNTNLKGWLPQYLIDQTLSTVMIDYVHSIRKLATVVESV